MENIIEVKAGTIIVEEGSLDFRAYIIQKGKVEVFKKLPSGKKLILAILSDGQIFGEMGLITERPRAAEDNSLVYNDLYLNDSPPFNVSRNHCSINFSENRYFVLDRGSTLGTIVNGKEIGGYGKNSAILDLDENELILGPSTSLYTNRLEI